MTDKVTEWCGSDGVVNIDDERSAKDDVVDWDEQQFHHITNPTHNRKTNCAGCRNLLELGHVGLLAYLQEAATLSIEALYALDCAFDFLIHRSSIISRGSPHAHLHT